MKKFLAGLAGIILFLVVWYLGTNGTKLGELLPGPIEVFGAFFRGLYTNIGPRTLVGHVLISVGRVFIAYSAGVIIGVSLGLGMGRNKVIESIFNPIYQVLRPIPPIAWIPIAILWFGLGEFAKYFLIFLAAFVNIVYNVYFGAKIVDPQLIGAARMLGDSKRQLFFRIVLPSVIPPMFAGMQVALSASWATVIAAEMVRSTDGVGWLIIGGMNTNNMVQILVGVLAIGFAGLLMATAMRGLEARLCSWRRSGK